MANQYDVLGKAPGLEELNKLSPNNVHLTIRGLNAGYGKMEILHNFDLTVSKGQSLCLIGPNGAGKSTILHSMYGFTNIFDGKIEFKNIWFKYKDDFVLQDFSLTINKGKTIALVGQSGSGKSTIANLVTRFYDVDKGEILIDGINIKDISLKSLRNLMGIVTQESILFNDSVENNIKLGNTEASDNDVSEASGIANALEFIEELPEKFETNIGDGGNSLSGGQKQRLSIARAVLKNPPIMILDEATSALDTESEQLVQKALEKMMENRTSLVIAHRLSTIQKADAIIVLKKGEIVEQGKHETLLKKKSEYFKLVEMQSLV